jgi:hypothetical protein
MLRWPGDRKRSLAQQQLTAAVAALESKVDANEARIAVIDARLDELERTVADRVHQHELERLRDEIRRSVEGLKREVDERMHSATGHLGALDEELGLQRDRTIRSEQIIARLEEALALSSEESGKRITALLERIEMQRKVRKAS